MVLKSGANLPVNQIISMLRWHSRFRRRLDGIRLRLDVKLEHSAGVIIGAAGVERLASHRSELVEIETVDEHVDRSHWVILDHIIIARCWEQRALPAIHPFDKALHLMPRNLQGILSRESQQTEYFFTQPGRKPEVAIQVGIELPPSRT
jgi:hypothetical protein